jgi:hypothetical protein
MGDMTRKLSGHIVNPANDKLSVEVLDGPGAGGANHLYGVYGFHTKTNESAADKDQTGLQIVFQNGPIGENGVNGITQEVLLEIVADRLRSFQAGPYMCRENAVALTHVETAQLWLKKRTMDRMARGVEGTHVK